MIVAFTGGAGVTDSERAALNALIAALRAEVAYLRDQVRMLTSEKIPNGPPCVADKGPAVDFGYIREITRP